MATGTTVEEWMAQLDPGLREIAEELRQPSLNATALRDPQRLMEGTGAKMRHVKVRSPKDVRPEQYSAWTRQAVALNEGRQS